MALTAGQINVGNYPQPDYSGVVQSARSAAAQGAEGISKAIGVVTDYAKEQKALAQKDKEMAAKIKGTISLLDNAKALYPDFAERIDATKLQLSDPSLSNLDKLGIAGNVEGSLNMMVTKGSDVMKARLIEAQIDEAKAGRAPKTEFTTLVDPKTGQEIPVIINFATNEATPVTAGNMPTTQPPSRTQVVQQNEQQLGDPPVMAYTREGKEIPVGESKPLPPLPSGEEQVSYQGQVYTLDRSVLPPKNQAGETRGLAINQAANLSTPSQFVAPGSEKKKLELQKLALEISNLQSGDKTKDTELLRQKREADLEGVLRKNRTEKALEESGQAKTPKKLQEIETATSEYDSGATQKAVNRLNAQGITYMGMPISTETIEGVLGTKESRAKEAQAVVEQSQAESQQELEAEQPMVQPTAQPQSYSASQQGVLDALRKANPNKSDSALIGAAQKNNLWPNQ
jgi:hypothetical protein